MYNYSEEEALLKNIRQVSSSFLYQINKAFNKDKEYYNTYQWSIEQVGYNTKTYVNSSFGGRLLITLDVLDILQYADINEIDVESATKLILSHEIFHILLGHCSSKYKNHDKKILNLAGDLEINQLIGLKSPGIQPEDFLLKPYRNTDYYYNMLINQVEKKKKDMADMLAQIEISNEKGSECQEGENSSVESETIETSENDSQNEEPNGEVEASSEVTPESGRGTQSIEERILEDMIPEGAMVNNATIEIMEAESIEINESARDLYRIEEVVKKSLSKKDTYSIKGLDEIVRKMINREKAVKITPHEKINTYYKFNNRKKRDFILPGKKLTNSGTKKKLDSSLTVFIDVSGSTRGRINIDLMNVARKMHTIGATIVYYRDRIVSICEPDKNFFTEYGGGGTRITDTVAEYVNKGYDLQRAYVFTDGQDNFLYLKDVCKKFTVYIVDGGKVYEKYTEKSNILSRWW